VVRYYNSWIENTDQVAEEDAASAEASSHRHLPAISDPVATASRQSLPTADAELSDMNMSTTHSVDDVSKDNDREDDDDDEYEDINDVFCSFM